MFSQVAVQLKKRIVSSTTGKRLLYGAFWSGIGSLLSKGLTVVASFCVARFCGKTAFGEYGMVVSTAGTLSTVCGMGIGHIVIRYIAELRKRDVARANRILALSTFVTIVTGLLFGGGFIAGADIIATKVLAAPHLSNMLRICALGIMLGTFNAVQIASLSGCEAYKERACISVVVGVVQSILIILSSYLWGLKGAIIAYSVSFAFSIIVTSLALKPIWRPLGLKRDFCGMFAEWRVLVSFGLPTVLLLFFGYPISWVTQVFLAHIPDGYGHLAIINAARPWSSALVFLVTTASTALIPVLSDLIGGGEKDRALSTVWKILKYNAMAVFPFCALLTLFAHPILRCYGESFTGGVYVFIVMIWSAGIGTIYQPLWNFLVGAEMMWTNFFIVFFTAIMQIVLAWVLIGLGGMGLAIAGLVVSVVRLGVLTIVLRPKEFPSAKGCKCE